ncbi:unnamed protein product [Cochlearia groenlandica]
MALKIIKISKVNPSTNSYHDSNDSLVLLPLTFFDLRWLKFHPTERLIFYKLNKHDSFRDSFYSLILPKLELSLSNVLRHYLPLAGRLVWDPQDRKPNIVVSPQDSVSLTVAESDADFNFVSGKGLRPETLVRSFVPEFSVSCDSPYVLALQVTLFPNQGFSIGVTAHHAVLDGKTTSMFLKAWAHNCSKQEHDDVVLPQDLIPFLDRTVVKDPSGIETKLLNRWISASNNKRSLKLFPSKPIGENIVRVTHRLTRENIQKLRERVETESRVKTELRLTTFVIAYGYMITCMVKARGGDPKRRVCIGFASDFRSRLNPPFPSTFFGNCIVGSGDFDAEAEPILEEGEGKGFISAVEKLSGWVTGLSPENIEKNMLSPFEAFKRMEPGRQMISVAGSTRLGIYGSDFGWGKPVKVEIVTIDKDASVSLSESGDGTGGVEIGFCLTKDDVERFSSLFSHGLN